METELRQRRLAWGLVHLFASLGTLSDRFAAVRARDDRTYQYHTDEYFLGSYNSHHEELQIMNLVRLILEDLGWEFAAERNVLFHQTKQGSIAMSHGHRFEGEGAAIVIFFVAEGGDAAKDIEYAKQEAAQCYAADVTSIVRSYPGVGRFFVAQQLTYEQALESVRLEEQAIVSLLGEFFPVLLNRLRPPQ